jgi:hypothetical protein
MGLSGFCSSSTAKVAHAPRWRTSCNYAARRHLHFTSPRQQLETIKAEMGSACAWHGNHRRVASCMAWASAVVTKV